jgi:hypothetical protein
VPPDICFELPREVLAAGPAGLVGAGRLLASGAMGAESPRGGTP